MSDRNPPDFEQALLEVERLRVEVGRCQARLELMTAIAGASIFHSLLHHKAVGFTRNILDLIGQMRRMDAYLRIEGEIRESLDLMEGGASELLHSLRGIQTRSMHEQVEEFCIQDLLREFFQGEFLFNVPRDVDVHLINGLDARAYVRANQWWVKQALRVVAENAVQAMGASSVKRLTVEASGPIEGIVEIRVKDTGLGIPSGIRSRLFREMITGKEKRGNGIGAAIAGVIVESFGGEIDVERTNEQGTDILLTLPSVRWA